MEYVPAVILWLVTIIRLPTALDRGRAPVLRGAFFAAVACTLFVPAIYNAADPFLGGKNHVGLVLIIAVLAGFWQFHTATVLAAISDEARRRRLLKFGRIAVAVAGTCVVVGFLSSHLEVANQNLPLAYGNQPGMQLFLWTGSAFIIWVCTDIATACLRFLPKMERRTLRSGFGCVAAGSFFMAMALGSYPALGVLKAVSTGPSAFIRTLEWSFPVLISIAVFLVGIGLALPRFHESAQAIRRNIRSRRLMLLLTPVWRRSSQERKYLLRNRWTPLLDPIAGKSAAHLHRRVIEIRDCQQRGLVLLPRDRVLINQAEQPLQGN